MEGKSSPNKDIDKNDSKCDPSATIKVDRNVDVGHSEPIRVLREMNNKTVRDNMFAFPLADSILGRTQLNICSSDDPPHYATIANATSPEPELSDHTFLLFTGQTTATGAPSLPARELKVVLQDVGSSGSSSEDSSQGSSPGSPDAEKLIYYIYCTEDP